jgi:hypothetical protein
MDLFMLLYVLAVSATGGLFYKQRGLLFYVLLPASLAPILKELCTIHVSQLNLVAVGYTVQ